MSETKGAATAEAQVPAKKDAGERRPEVLVSERGMAFRTLDEIFRFGLYAIRSGMFPQFTDASQIVIVHQIAADNGIAFSVAMQNIAFINGKACMYGDALIAAAWGNPNTEDISESMEGSGDAKTACCSVKRRGKPEPVTRKFSIADAKAAGLLPGKPMSAWSKYPDRMIQMRARSWAVRDAGVVQGVIAREEADDIIKANAVTVQGHVVSDNPNGQSRTDRLAEMMDKPKDTLATTVNEFAELLDAENAAASSSAPESPAAVDDPPAGAPAPVDHGEAVSDVTMTCPSCHFQNAILVVYEDGSAQCQNCEATFDSVPEEQAAAQPDQEEKKPDPKKESVKPDETLGACPKCKTKTLTLKGCPVGYARCLKCGEFTKVIEGGQVSTEKGGE